MADGIDPIEEKRKQKDKKQKERLESKRQQITLKDLWEEFYADRKHKLKESTLGGYSQCIKVGLKTWLNRPIMGISREDVLRRHRQLGETSGKPYANGALRVLSSVITFGITRGRLETNPVTVLRREWFPEYPRKTTIPDNKLPAWFRALEELRKLDYPPSARLGCDYLEFLLFTGLRRTEGATLKWTNVDFGQNTTTITNTKNKCPLVLPLSGHLVDLLSRRKIEADKTDSQWVFPSTCLKRCAGFFSEPKYIADIVGEACGVGFTIHDLRRTFITVAAPLVSYPVLKALVNHKAKSKGDVTLDYFSPTVRNLREPMQAITDYLLTKKADGLGLRLAKAQ